MKKVSFFKIILSSEMALSLILAVGLLCIPSLARAKTDFDHVYMLPGEPDNYEEVGQILAHGDFFGNGYQDLVISVPHANTTLPGGGEVYVIYGYMGPQGLVNMKTINHITGALYGRVETFTVSGGQTTLHKGAHFGVAVAVGDFDNNGYDDLAIGIPDEDVGDTVDAGAVWVIYGTSGG
ncbi:MAG: hypothetical protein ACMUHX_05735, partial [bacterium]